MSHRSCYRSFFFFIPFPSGNSIQTLSKENPTADTKIIPQLKKKKCERQSSIAHLFHLQHFTETVVPSWGCLVICFQLWLRSNAAWGEILLRQSLFTHWMGVLGTAWLAEKPSPQSDVTSVKFHCEEGGGKRSLPFSMLTNENKSLQCTCV